MVLGLHNITPRDFEVSRVYLFNKGGEYKLTFKSTDPAGKFLFLSGITVSSVNQIVITDFSTDVKIFDVNGSFINSFSTLAPGEQPIPRVTGFAAGITVNNQNEIRIGDWDRKCITIHTQSGKLIAKTTVYHAHPPCYK